MFTALHGTKRPMGHESEKEVFKLSKIVGYDSSDEDG